ncbi:MAG: PSD1 and planctomycete cytochrome C domain-containing protein [Planctomycetota bacterium]
MPATLFAIALCTLLGSALAAAEVDFETQIAPIFENRCLHCHGEVEQEAGLRLDRRPSLLVGGDSGAATVVPGEPEKSYLLEVINHVDEDMAMPPDDDKMPQAEIDLLTRWVKEGAKWPGQMDAVLETKSDHWSFQRVQRPPAPEAPLQPVDAFLAHALESRGLQFSPPADPRSLIRRASIVLTGLAPSPDDIEAFVEEYEQNADTAFVSLVDRLLESPHFGERWAQHWLDVIRWAETNGSEANLYRKNAWIYRDYVVRAFNEDLPYDQFVRQQIAGDSLGVGEATGFLVAGPHVPAATVGREPSAIRQARADRMDEIMHTVGASVMGVTIGCARCHNHKFDPISIRDYYSMTAVFQDIEFGSRFPEFSQDHPRRQRGEAIWKDIAAERQKLRQLGGWEENWGAYREWHFAPAKTKSIRIRFKMPNVTIDELEVFAANDRDTNLALKRLGSTITSNADAGVDNRNPIDRINDGEYGTMTWRASFPKEGEERAWVRVDFAESTFINRLRLSSNREYYYDTDYLDRKPFLPRYEFDLDVLGADGEWKPWVGTWYVNKKLNQEHPKRKSSLAAIQRSIEQLAEQGPRPSFVGRFVPVGATHVLMRGSPESPRDEVAPAGPEVFGGSLELDGEATGAERRAEFADWIASADNPLTARVMVNRIWHHLFGRGLVATTSDFGKAGAAPSHPELLDWLAAEFIEPTVQPDAKPWSMKSMIRMLVLSKAFRQGSAPEPTGLAKDAGASLLWRFPPKRVEAEVIRDSILQASGELNRAVGGRSYRIHNEKKTYAQWEVLDNHGPETWRRMLYQERMRRVDDRMFTAFDFPDCGQVRAKRPVSTTPLQALNLMNSRFVMDQSDRIAQRAWRESGGGAAAIERCFELILGRLPADAERQACEELAKEDLALVCRALINSNEFAFLP